MWIITNRQMEKFIEKASSLEIALSMTNDREYERNNNMRGLTGFDDLVHGIRDVVRSVGGQRAFDMYASRVLDCVNKRRSEGRELID